MLVAAVCGEIEKTQQGDAQGAQYRGYAAGSRYLVTHGGVADMCLLGEPTEGKVVLGHFGSLWVRIRVHGNFIHTAFSEGRRDQNSILRMHEVLAAVLEWIPTWEDDPSNAYRGAKAIVNVGAIQGGFGWRVSRTPHHTDLFLDVRVPPTKPMARGAARGARDGARAREPSPTTASRARSTSPRPAPRSTRATSSSRRSTRRTSGLRREARARRHALVQRRVGADAATACRHVNYGTSTGLMDVELGENLEIDGLVKTAEVYARVAMEVCGSHDGRRRSRRPTCRCRRTTAPPTTSSGSSCRRSTLDVVAGAT